MAKFGSTLCQVKKFDIIFLLLLHVGPPLMFTVTSFQATPINSLAVPSPSLRVYQYNKLDMMTFCEQNFTIVSTPLFSISAGSTFYLEE